MSQKSHDELLSGGSPMRQLSLNLSDNQWIIILDALLAHEKNLRRIGVEGIANDVRTVYNDVRLSVITN